MNTLYYGDNLVWLRDRKYFPDESIDLIYLDPPFNSKADYNILFKEPISEDKSRAQIKAFDDTWHWDSESSDIAFNELAQNRPEIAEFISWLSRQDKGYKSIAAYLSMMATRLIELHRILKPTGSIYLHCDPTASHYIKVLMDIVFGTNYFINEVIWFYKTGGTSKRHFSRKHDVLLLYSKTNNYKFIPQKEKSYLKYKYGFSNIEILSDEEGYYTEVGMRDVWDIPALRGNQPEKLAYPTQKPEALLERIINASSQKGDIVLDPFCGCGTTISVAERLNRQWIGIDVTWLSIDLIDKRLKDTYKDKVIDKYNIKGKPTDLASAKALAIKSKKEFEIWAISLVGAHPREHDGGVDGIFGFTEKDRRPRTIIVQVKGGDTVNPEMIRALKGTVENEKAAIGLFITLVEPTKGMRDLAIHSPHYKSELWGREYPSIQIRTIAELLDGKGFDLPPTIDPFKRAKVLEAQATQLEL
jgi:site-specific DNA-methyltransferase (adenine-specific)